MNAWPDTAPAWRADLAATPLLAWRGGQLAVVARKVDTVLAAWASDWGITPRFSARVDCTAVEDACDSLRWQALGGAGQGGAWTCSGTDRCAQLAQALFGGAARVTSLVEEIAESCWSDARARLQSLLVEEGAACTSPPPSTLPAWSGAAMVSLPFGARLLLAADIVRKLVAAAAPPATRAVATRETLLGIPEAIGEKELRVQVHLAGCEIEIGTLQDLQVGDVLRLRQGIDKPASVSVEDGTPIFGGFLVRSGGRKAIELACVTS